MDNILQRDILTDSSTSGSLFIDGNLEYFTLEDKMREVHGKPVSEWKVKGHTAIPVGRYRVTIAPSPKRGGRLMPLLLAVPGFVGIQIHPGNTAEDTEGCILLGTWREPDAVRGSKVAFQRFFEELSSAIRRGEEVWIDVRNPRLPVSVQVDGVDT
jgi:hypothetical protein